MAESEDDESEEESEEEEEEDEDEDDEPPRKRRYLRLQYTVLTKSIGTPAILSDNAQFLPENDCNYKCFGSNIFIYFACNEKTQKRMKKKSNQLSIYTKLQKWAGQKYWHPLKNHVMLL